MASESEQKVYGLRNRMCRGTLLSLEELFQYTGQLRLQKQATMATNGTFDLLHYRQVPYRQEAIEQGDVLIIGVNGDAAVPSMEGPVGPIMPADRRTETILACRCVNAVDYIR